MEIQGLPLHPLVVHAVVVLVPLSALGGIAIAVLGWARERYASLVVVGSFAASVSTFVAERAGQDLLATFEQPTAAMTNHANLGTGLFWWTVLLFAGTMAVLLGQVLIDRQQARGRIVLIIGIVMTVVGALASLIQTVRIGHSGSFAVWGG